jgi:hypothetical protein
MRFGMIVANLSAMIFEIILNLKLAIAIGLIDNFFPNTINKKVNSLNLKWSAHL